MPKPKAKKRDRSTESRITRAICLPHATDKALVEHSLVADRSVSWCVNKAITEYLKTCAAA